MQINMKKKKMLFIGSLPTKRVHFNGETNKTGDIYHFFKKTNKFKITKINLTHHKLINTLRMIVCSKCFKYDCIFISKCITGGSLAMHLILKFGRKKNKNNIYVYWIGNGTNGLDVNSEHLSDLKYAKNVIFESDQVYQDNKDLGIKNYSICPCIKPTYDIQCLEKIYLPHERIKCIYFSRICKEKGLMDAIVAVEKANERLGATAFSLDIAGSPTSDSARVFEKEMLNYIKGKDEFTYFGKDFCVTGIETYLRLQKYDLHLFPSQFKQECVPGTIVDMFIAGVPTLSSSFPNVRNLLSDNDSFIFEQGNTDDLVDKLVFIYNNNGELSNKRKPTFDLQNRYNEVNFNKLMHCIGIL